VGSEGRKEVKIDLFESTLIPLPSTDEQRALVNTYEYLEGQRADLEAKMREQQNRLNSELLACASSQYTASPEVHQATAI
jgi:CRISPR/Cas system CSM-associated protein Csm4 (group 5 of RAMP superfamily)